jgi:prepilin-type N-terminal cleavage/methylation domain-containing protein
MKTPIAEKFSASRRVPRWKDRGLGMNQDWRTGRKAGEAAFSLVEIMVVVAIISVLASLALPSAKRYQLNSRATVIASDLRTFAGAFEAYAQENGAFPPESGPGEMPAGMTGRLGATEWGRVTPLGGQYNWENNQQHGGVRYRASICISESSSAPLEVNAEMLQAIDKIVDDGDLTTGNFRTGVNNDALYIIQQ